MEKLTTGSRFVPPMSGMAMACLLAAFPGHAEETASLEAVVVTGRRTVSRLEDTPQRIEIIDAQDIERTPARELTDLLKKNSSVDVIQYPGNLSGIGIRGFVPEFSGINKRSLLLVDGRPAMSTNLSLVNMDQIERVEVLKGPASALYGSQAMGGVINIITRESRGPIKGFGQFTLGEFDTKEIKGRVGGKLGESMDFDYAGSFYDQGNFVIGNGELRPNTAYGQQNHALRFGLDVTPEWRLTAKTSIYRGRDIATPGDLAYGLNQQSNKEMDSGGSDVKLTGRLGAHTVSATAYGGRQWYETTTKTSTTASVKQYLPYRSFEEDLHWRGLQAQDVWDWATNASLVLGLDTEQAKSVTLSYNPNGTRKGPFSADNTRDTTGIYAENTWRLNSGDTVVYVGLRNDRIQLETLDTPYKTGFTPTAASFSSTNPSAGFKQLLGAGVRLHGTVGQGFVAPSASELTGAAITVVAGKNEITRGNPGLKPESSLTWDLGAEWSHGAWFMDATVFDTTVRDKIARDGGTKSDPNNTVFTYINATSARMQGLELEGRWQLNPAVRLSVAGTAFFNARKEVATGWEDINTVAKHTVRLALDSSLGAWSGRVGARYVGRTKDQDWVNDSSKQVEYGGYAVWDLSARYRIDLQQSVTLSVDNLFDRLYSEKYGFPQPGRNLKVSYRHDF